MGYHQKIETSTAGRRGRLGGSFSFRVSTTFFFCVVVCFIAYLPCPSLQEFIYEGCDIEKSSGNCEAIVYLEDAGFIKCGAGATNVQPDNLLTAFTFCRTPLGDETAKCGERYSLPANVGNVTPFAGGTLMITTGKDRTFMEPIKMYARCSSATGVKKVMYITITLYPMKVLTPGTNSCIYDTFTPPFPLETCTTLTFINETARVNCGGKMRKTIFFPPDVTETTGEVCTTEVSLDSKTKDPTCLVKLPWSMQVGSGTIVTYNKASQDISVTKPLSTKNTGVKSASWLCYGDDEKGTRVYFGIFQQFIPISRPTSPLAYGFPTPIPNDGSIKVCNKGVCNFDANIGDTIVINCTKSYEIVPTKLLHMKPEVCLTNLLPGGPIAKKCPSTALWSNYGDPVISYVASFSGVKITQDKVPSKDTVLQAYCNYKGSSEYTLLVLNIKGTEAPGKTTPDTPAPDSEPTTSSNSISQPIIFAIAVSSFLTILSIVPP